MSDDEFHGFDEEEDGARALPNDEEEDRLLARLMRKLMTERVLGLETNEERRERSLHPEEVKKLLPTFASGKDVKKWCANVNHFKMMYNWTDQTTLLYASCQLEGAAREWYKSVQTKIATWTQFQMSIQTAFPDDDNEAEIHLVMSDICKQKTESYEHYVFRAEALAARGHMSEQAKVTYIIRGLSLDPIYDQISSNRFGSCLELLNRIRWCESNNTIRRKRSALTTTTEGASKQQNTNAAAVKSGQNNRKCFNCNALGHVSVDCKLPQRLPRCLKCHRTGHEERQCIQQFQQPSNPKPQLQRQRPAQQITNLVECTTEADLDVDENGQFLGHLDQDDKTELNDYL
ncbi:uncharacterized protein LOC129733855 isoform X2 [Wyeomyia smithii]|uniref:uncharacterized protein LOC129733855 isoform X2 n=1 Tax=Wyeomyia smithii TaxID=174621 RepID=UPI0024682185|nr:uncharacterized protein LOC129733855 isoform X2 [Wyeomyia smithii]